MNKQILIGRLGKDPELSYTKTGKALCKFSLCTVEGKTQDGKDDLEWHNIQCWEKTAELAKQYLDKGRLVCIEGRTRNVSWLGQDGTKKYMTIVEARHLEFLGPMGHKQHLIDESVPVQTKQDELFTTDNIPF
jgi:single-strand DNA-binding protein